MCSGFRARRTAETLQVVGLGNGIQVGISNPVAVVIGFFASLRPTAIRTTSIVANYNVSWTVCKGELRRGKRIGKALLQPYTGLLEKGSAL